MSGRSCGRCSNVVVDNDHINHATWADDDGDHDDDAGRDDDDDDNDDDDDDDAGLRN